MLQILNEGFYIICNKKMEKREKISEIDYDFSIFHMKNTDTQKELSYVFVWK